MPQRRVTRKDVAVKAGVSVTVVSYVLNKGPRPVSLGTRQRVEKAIEELGYYPNELARSLRSRQTATIGLVIPNLNNPVYAEIASSMERICAQYGYLILLCNSGRDPEREEEFIHMLRAKQVDGVVITPTQSPLDLIRPLQAARIPIVVLEHDLPEQHCIAIDDLQGSRLATEHLLRLGHRRIGLIRRTPSTATSSQRATGYRLSLAEAGISYDPQLVVECNAGYAEGFRAMQHLLGTSHRPTAVLTHNDVLAIGAMQAVRQAGLNIPANISIIGYDDIASAAYLIPPLTTIRFPKEEMGRQAASMILSLVSGQEEIAPQTHMLPVELVVRNSTAPPPAL